MNNSDSGRCEWKSICLHVTRDPVLHVPHTHTTVHLCYRQLEESSVNLTF